MQVHNMVLPTEEFLQLLTYMYFTMYTYTHTHVAVYITDYTVPVHCIYKYYLLKYMYFWTCMEYIYAQCNKYWISQYNALKRYGLRI